MSNTLTYIDQYFRDELPPAEKSDFENRCVSDPAFAEEVAFYVSTRAVLKETLQDQKKAQMAGWYAELSARQPEGLSLEDDPFEGLSAEPEEVPQRQPQELVETRRPRGVLRSLAPYLKFAAAACLILVIGWQLFFRGPSANQLADNYVAENLQVLGVNMGSGSDSLQAGIAAYNRKDYGQAEGMFRALDGHAVYGAEAVKNLGVVYLVTGRYDEAIRQFDRLAGFSGLRVNEGYFYKSIALIKRDKPGDRAQAKQLLEKIEREDMFGSEQAGKWRKNL